MRFLRVLKTRRGKPIDFAASEPKIEKLCRKYKVNLFYVFGSYAGGNPGTLSDLDLAYYSKHKVKELEFLAELQELYEEEAIDLVNLKKTPLPLIHRVLKGKCIYASDIKVKIEFETHADALYFDTARLRKEYFTHMMERIKHGTFGTG